MSSIASIYTTMVKDGEFKNENKDALLNKELGADVGQQHLLWLNSTFTRKYIEKHQNDIKDLLQECEDLACSNKSHDPSISQLIVRKLVAVNTLKEVIQSYESRIQ